MASSAMRRERSMTGTGKAAVFLEHERRFELRDLPIPDVEPGAAQIIYGETR